MTLLTEPAKEEESRPGATQQRSCVRRQTARTARTLIAGTKPSYCTDGIRDGTLRDAKCAALRRAGSRVAPEGGCLSAADSPGSSEAGRSQFTDGANLT